MTRNLRAAGWDLPDSAANFVWLETGVCTSALEECLRHDGVLVRAWEGEGLRITIGSAEENDRVLSTLARLVAEGVIDGEALDEHSLDTAGGRVDPPTAEGRLMGRTSSGRREDACPCR